MKKIVLVLGIMLLAAGAAQATPSTQIWIPSTDIQAYKTFHLGIDQYVTVEKNDDGSRTPAVIVNGITTGVLPFQKIQAEIGIDQKALSAEPADSNPLYFNAKIGTPEGSLFAGSPAIAVGGYDFGTKTDVTDYNVVYGLVAKTFGAVGRISVGYFSGNDKLLGADEDTGLLASWDRTLSEISDKLWVAVDYMGGESGYGATSFGAAWLFAPNVGVIAGYDIYTNDAIKPTATLQLDINF